MTGVSSTFDLLLQLFQRPLDWPGRCCWWRAWACSVPVWATASWRGSGGAGALSGRRRRVQRPGGTWSSTWSINTLMLNSYSSITTILPAFLMDLLGLSHFIKHSCYGQLGDVSVKLWKVSILPHQQGQGPVPVKMNRKVVFSLRFSQTTNITVDLAWPVTTINT